MGRHRSIHSTACDVAATEPHTEADPRLDETGERPAAPRVPTLEALSALLGIDVVHDAGNVALGALRKALPGYAGVLRAAADRLAEDTATQAFSVHGVPAEALAELAGRQAYLRGVEALLASAHRSVVVQRALVDDRAIGMLRKVRAALRLERSSDLDLRWSDLIDYHRAFAGGAPTHKRAARTADDPQAPPLGEPVE